ncbi:hypothetical protein B2G71_13500 [Novosphingobium sp. PC22D]|uniref:DUF2497 domain-containing protein n=1 Tax=Novosphingobium sp. PC22D TaxID=1962403 RepID=UPI000BF0779D|nr:DUF2497 domain-containing protein [Novosphingobium sp. PC22D]PEQ12153.1 hypothetical protein B2G71_13500 [Novosphingobium sp. PC22D]
MRQAGEPTVEEILDSIKKVIARDNRDSAAQERHRRETEGVSDPKTAEETETFPEEDVLDLGAMAEYSDFEDQFDEDEDQDGETGPLLTSEAQANMRESLAALAMLAKPGAPPQIVRSGETSLEGLVRELLRPALAEWLDKNLPPMVEQLVAAEIARIVGKKD